MYTQRLDEVYVSDLCERERKRHPFLVDTQLQALLSTRTLQKTDFTGPRMKFAERYTAVDVIRQAVNLMNEKACRLARRLESHVDFNLDCCDAHLPKSPPSSTSPRGSILSSQSSLTLSRMELDTFDGIVEGFLNLIAGTLTIVIERGNNNVLCDAVEAVVAHVNFVDTIKLSLIRPLLTTYPTSSQVTLGATSEGVAASFHCLMGHTLPDVLLFSNISTILALEDVITAPCLARIFYCYWSCLHANLNEFEAHVASSSGLPAGRRRHYAGLLSTAEKQIERQEARLYMSRYINTDSWPDLPISLTTTTESRESLASSNTSISLIDASSSDDVLSVASDRPQEDPFHSKEFSFSLFRSKTPVSVRDRNAKGRKNLSKRWSFIKSM